MRTVLSQLRASIANVRAIADHVDLETPTPLNRQRHETTCCAAVVILSGYFEGFIRDVIQAFIRDVSARNKPFVDLPKKMQSTHYKEGSMILHNVVRNRAAWVRASQQSVLTRLHTVQASAPYDLLWEAFANTGSNPSPNTVKEVLERCAVSKVWKKIATHSLRQRSELMLTSLLQSFIEVRHECAHSGRASVIPTPSEIRDHVDLIDDIATGIVVTLEDQLSTI